MGTHPTWVRGVIALTIRRTAPGAVASVPVIRGRRRFTTYIRQGLRLDTATSGQHAESMPHLQIKHVPPELHRELKERAATEGVTLSDHLIARLTDDLRWPSARQLERRVEDAARTLHLEPGEAAAIVREGRGD